VLCEVERAQDASFLALTQRFLTQSQQHASAWNGHVQPLLPTGQLVTHPVGFPPPRVNEKKEVGEVSQVALVLLFEGETRRSSAASMDLFLRER
jgi:hypothetical protein